MENPNAYADDGTKLREHVMSREFYDSPEFVALCDRFGIARNLRTTDLKITVPVDGLVTVEHVYQASAARARPDGVVDTTDAHNKRYRTFARGDDGPTPSCAPRLIKATGG